MAINGQSDVLKPHCLLLLLSQFSQKTVVVVIHLIRGYSILQLWGPSEIPWQRYERPKTSRRKREMTPNKRISVSAFPVPFPTSDQIDLDSVVQNCYAEAWKCSICAVEFRSKDRLKMHMKGHFGQLNHKCSLCNKAFWKKEDLDGHMASTHTNEKLFHCRICGNFFSYKRSLRLHLKAVHNTDWRNVPNS